MAHRDRVVPMCFLMAAVVTCCTRWASAPTVNACLGQGSPLANRRILIYMSIRTWIGELVTQERLFELKPVFPGEPVRRPMFLSEEVHRIIEGPWPDAKAASRCNQLRADLENFVVGREIGLCVRPFEAGAAHMGLLDPVGDGIWDVRSQDPKPGLRVLGCFAEKDIFLGLLVASRSQRVGYIPRGPLGDRDSQEWKDIIRATKACWRSLMATYQPVVGNTIDDYFSDGYNPL